MICIRCEKDSTYSQRKNRVCPYCNGKFAFEPRDGDPISDKAFQKAIEIVSGQGRIQFLLDHLYYEVARRKPLFPVLILLIPLAFLILVLPTLLFNKIVGGKQFVLPPVEMIAGQGLVFVSLTLLQFRWGNQRNRLVRLSRETFQTLYDRWTQAHGKPNNLIEGFPVAASVAPLEPDIAEYSFDRAVICDRSEMVDFLIANNFHFENNCAVLSATGYPKPIFETVRGMLRKNLRLVVAVLHDCTPNGCRLAERLYQDRSWFADVPVRVVDVGLRPADCEALKGSWLEAESLIDPVDGIRPDEAKWLSHQSCELTVIRPELLLKRLYLVFQDYTPTTAELLAGSTGLVVGGVVYDSAFQPRRSEIETSSSTGDGVDSFG